MEEKKQVKKGKNPEEKRKIIAFSIIGVVVLVIIGFALSNLSSEEENKPISEMETPESESEKLNSKLEAIGVSEKTEDNSTSLDAVYSKKTEEEPEEKTESQKKILAQIKDLENSKETNNSNNVTNVPVKTQRKSNYRNYNNDYNNYNSNDYVTPRKRVAVEEPVKTNIPKEKSEKEEENTSNSGFYRKNKATKINSNSVVYAVVHGNQEVSNNQRVVLRTTREFNFNGSSYPINTKIYGLCSIQPNRLLIKISKINQEDLLMNVFDSEDSELGLYVLTPHLNSALSKELKKEGLNDEDLSRIPFSKTLKGIFEKKIKEERVQLLNNYKVIIKIKKDD